jgi:hypothetical protein
VRDDFSSRGDGVLAASGNLKEVDRWSFEEIAVGDGYVAAVAGEGRNLSTKCRDWRG